MPAPQILFPHVVFFLALLLAPLPPAAALEKCVSADGKISYSEQPCAKGSKRTAIGGGTVSASGGTSYTPPADVKIEYYEVQGADYNPVLASMMTGRQFAGRTDWHLSYKYQWRMAEGACKPESVTTTLTLGMTMPRWSPPPGATGELVGRWERFITALRVHEDGHVQLARNLEGAAKRGLLAVSAPNCAALDAALRARFDQILEHGRAADRDYDKQTGHGRTQDATFR